jgi:hypothetical protein
MHPCKYTTVEPLELLHRKRILMEMHHCITMGVVLWLMLWWSKQEGKLQVRLKAWYHKNNTNV